MTGLIGKLDDLVFDRGTVARSNPLDLSAVEGRTLDILTQNLERPVGGVRNVALDLFAVDAFGTKREGRGLAVAGLRLEHVPVNRAAIEPRRRARLQSSAAKSEATKHLPQHHGCRLPATA